MIAPLQLHFIHSILVSVCIILFLSIIINDMYLSTIKFILKKRVGLSPRYGELRGSNIASSLTFEGTNEAVSCGELPERNGVDTLLSQSLKSRVMTLVKFSLWRRRDV